MESTLLHMRFFGRAFGLAAVITALSGCSQPASRPPMPRPGASAPKMTLEEIGQSAFGTLYQSAKKDGSTADFVFTAPDDTTPAATYRRAVILTATAIPSTLRNEPDIQKMRFTTVDPKDKNRKLVVFSLTRDQGASVGGHGSFDGLLDIVKIESADSEFKAVTGKPKH